MSTDSPRARRNPQPAVATIPDMTSGERGVYLWLRAEPPGGVVEFPIQRPLSHSPLVYQTRGVGGYLNTLYQYRTLIHHHPIVNGHSGYEPLLNVVLRRQIEAHEIGDALLMLRSVGVRCVIVHPPASSTLLGDWYANVLFVYRKPLILAVSARTLLPVLIPARDPASLLPRLAAALGEILKALGIPARQVEHLPRHARMS